MISIGKESRSLSKRQKISPPVKLVETGRDVAILGGLHPIRPRDNSAQMVPPSLHQSLLGHTLLNACFASQKPDVFGPLNAQYGSGEETMPKLYHASWTKAASA